ncbi:MAG: transporter substrate-binding domain-containing protein [Trichococcus sp.]|uniref:transporter substrate-binding domain-containing protein n=1 Tax=Trichococcus sp. TaxID=1985464 RepID=UPI003C49CB2D
MMKVTKKKMFVTSALSALLLMSGCTKVSEKSVMERIESGDKKIVWATNVTTPLVGQLNVETGEVAGYDSDVARALTEVITGSAENAVFVEVSSQNRVAFVKNNIADAVISTMTITDEREKQVDFTDSYYIGGQALIVPEDSEIQAIEDLTADTIVAGAKGTTMMINMKTIAPQAPTREYDTESEAFTTLIAGQADAYTSDNVVLMGMMSKTSGFRFAGGRITDEPYGIALNEDEDAFREALNEAIAIIRENGTLAEIEDKWFGDYY